MHECFDPVVLILFLASATSSSRLPSRHEMLRIRPEDEAAGEAVALEFLTVSLYEKVRIRHLVVFLSFVKSYPGIFSPVSKQAKTNPDRFGSKLSEQEVQVSDVSC